jgi:hypothetical protein
MSFKSANITVPMSHREKAAWLSLLAMALAFVPYFVHAALHPPTDPLPDLGEMGRFAAAVAAQIVVLAVGHAWLRLRAPEDARAPADERDRAIASRSLRIAYPALIVGMVLVGCVMPFHAGGWRLIHAGILMIVIAEVIHHGAIVWSYRRG